MLVLTIITPSIPNNILHVETNPRNKLSLIIYCINKSHFLAMPCERNPCRNGARCFDVDQTNYTCQCTDGFEGKDCETRIRCEALMLTNLIIITE